METTTSFINSSHPTTIKWRWEDMCGPNGLQLWSPVTHDLGICFQQLCLQIPVLSILAITSAYYFGRHINYVVRNKTQLTAINIRCIAITLFAILPILQTYSALESNDAMFPITYLLSGIQALAWIAHLGYSIILRTRLSLSSRGPIFVGVIWSLLAVSSIIFLRSNINIYKRSINPDYPIYVGLGFSIANVIFHILYAITLFPSEGAVYAIREPQMTPEREPLLSSLTAFNRLSEDQDPHYLGIAMEDTTWLSKLLFHWVNPLMQKGYEQRLNHPDDLYDLPDTLNSTALGRKFDSALIGNREGDINQTTLHSESVDSSIDVIFAQRETRKTSLIRALHKCFWLQFYSIGILKFTADCSAFAGPMLLNRLVSFIENKDDDIRLGYLYAGGLLLSSLIGALCNAHFNFLMSVVGLKIRAALVTKIYKKTLSVGGTVLNSAFSVGEIVNFMSTDTDRVVNSCPSFHSLWSIPLQLGIALYLLYEQVGLAFLTGVAFSIILIPINKLIANKIGKLSTKLMEKKDNRVKIMTEILRGIRSIKLYVWESHFIRLITKIREEELKYLKGRKYLDALCVYFWATTPVLISILTFATYVIMGNKLTASTVFTSMALLNMLIGPLNAFPWVLNGITEAWVSITRIQRLIDLPDLDLNKYYDDIDNDENALVIKSGNFNWNKLMSTREKSQLHSSAPRLKGKGKGKKSRISESEETSQTQLMDFYLNDINIHVNRGEFIGVMGSVGGGKSSILNAVMAELTKQGGQIAVADLERGFGYVSQQPWLQRGTIRDNILFGKNYDENKYVSVVQACGLTEDFQTWPDSDLTGIGEAGMTLSGGQKARIALARAVYQDKQIYLLDDVLSAVDVKVAKYIFQNCILGLLKGKTIILCSHNLQHLLKADKIVVMENGHIQKQGRPEDILSESEAYLNMDIDIQDSINSQASLLESIRSESTKKDNDSILGEETHETGNIQISVLASYWKAIGHLLSISILLSILLMQSSRNMTDWWLSYWVTNEESNSTNYTLIENIFIKNSSMYTTNDYLTIYAIFAVSNSIFTLFRAFLFAYGGITAACKVHKLLLKSIVRSKITFFDISPLGRILNRFSSDTYTIDDSLPFILNILLAQFFGLLGSIIITLYGLPWLSLILVPLFPIYSWLQSHYRLTSRELKRLSSVTLSPVYSHFNESLQGLSTIRAFRSTRRFKRDNEENVEMNQKAQFASQAAAQWLSLRLQFIGVALVTGVGLLAVIQHQFDVADPGLVGLAISYALSVTGLLNGVVNAFTETEREMIAVERVNQYTEEVTPEKTAYIMDPPYAWPSQGVICFNNVGLKYRDHLVPSLININFETRPAEKIGVVGRTGAGKSSLLVSLFRLVELCDGDITIDSVNISHISIAALRSRLSCIPQEPFLFSGTVRENLDPLDEFRDAEIWSALGKVDLTPKIRRLGGLEHLITSGGSNLSVGQRQLFCLARALLHNAKILCVDEATANVDSETDRKIQQTLRSSFRKSTVITIAHRIQTIMDCDRVLVMSEGRAIEFDNPEVLLNDSNSHFYQLVNQE